LIGYRQRDRGKFFRKVARRWFGRAAPRAFDPQVTATAEGRLKER
jgi:hypothetical protein